MITRSRVMLNPRNKPKRLRKSPLFWKILVRTYYCPLLIVSEFADSMNNLLSIVFVDNHLFSVVTAVAARGGMETLRPALHRVYMTRASNYKDALASFIKGYHEGVQQVMQNKEESQVPRDESSDNSKKTT